VAWTSLKKYKVCSIKTSIVWILHDKSWLKTQGMLTHLRHLIPHPVFPGVRVSQFVYLTCNSYLNFETDYSSVSWPFHWKTNIEKQILQGNINLKLIKYMYLPSEGFNSQVKNHPLCHIWVLVSLSEILSFVLSSAHGFLCSCMYCRLHVLSVVKT
jgi:hypothetical protein